MNGKPEPNRPPKWDQERADQLLGGRILIGLTRTSPDGSSQQEQMFGTIVAADASGIRVDLHGTRKGEEYHLPPDLSAIEPAAPGTYRLRATGEQVVDPDYLATWTIHPPPK